MSLYAVQNDEDKWLGCEIYCDEPDWFDHGGFMWNILSVAEENMKLYGGHIVKLGEEPAPIVVSEEEDKVLKKAKNTTIWRPAAVISKYAYNAAKDSDQEALLEDRLMRAYVIGWVVAKPKRWNIKVPHMAGYWYTKCGNNELAPANALVTDYVQFTDAEIEHYGLQDCEKKEVTDDGMGC